MEHQSVLDSQNSNISDISRNLSNDICHLIRTKSSFENCPEVAKQYSKKSDSGKSDSGDVDSQENLKRKLDDTQEELPALKRQNANTWI